MLMGLDSSKLLLIPL
uniref:Uncharacterized protein n=1 Tax=Arundo donax TaxID=35708 RepID=A0A0A9E489_ARUDO